MSDEDPNKEFSICNYCFLCDLTGFITVHAGCVFAACCWHACDLTHFPSHSNIRGIKKTCFSISRKSVCILQTFWKRDFPQLIRTCDNQTLKSNSHHCRKQTNKNPERRRKCMNIKRISCLFTVFFCSRFYPFVFPPQLLKSLSRNSQ